MLDDILATLGHDDTETKIYLALLDFGPQSVGSLAKKLGIPRTSLYGMLRRLVESTLVLETLDENVSCFSASPPERINQLFRQRKENLEAKELQLKALLPQLEKKRGSRSLKPKMQLFEGVDGLQAVLKDMLLYSNLDTFAFWPIRSMLEVLTPEFFRYLNKERIRSNLYTRALWPADQVVDFKRHPYLGIGKEFLREIRIAPPEVKFSMGYWAYGHKVAWISSRAESFGFVIESQEFVDSLQTQFQFIWKQSTLLKVNPQDSRSFLEEIKLLNK